MSVTADPLNSAATSRRSLDIYDVSDALKVSRRHVERMLAANVIPGVFRVGRLVRIEAAKFEKWVASGCPGAA